MAKNKSEDFKKAENELNFLMDRFESNFVEGKKVKGEDIEEQPKIKDNLANEIDLDELDEKLQKDAKGLIDSLYNLYFSAGLIKKNTVLRKKKEIDEMNLSNMFFQVNTIKLSIKAAQKIINRGDPHPRLLEAVSDLHVKFSEVTKNLANYVLFLEDTCKVQRNDFLSGETPSVSASPEFAAIAEKSEFSKKEDLNVIEHTHNNMFNRPDNKKLITDPKALVDSIQQVNSKMDKIKLDNKPLTDPYNKENLASEIGIDLKEINSEEDYDEINEIV